MPKPQPASDAPFVRTDLHSIEPYSTFLGICKSGHTHSNYHQDLKILKKFLDDRKIAGPVQARPDDLAKFVGHLSAAGTTPSGKARPAYSTKTVKRILASVRSFYRYLTTTQQTAHDPSVVFRNLIVRSPQRNPKPLPAKDREALVSHLRSETLDDLRISLVVLLGYHCGLRVSEIAGLKFADIDLAEGFLTVIGKGDKERLVPISDLLDKYLKDYFYELDRQGLRTTANGQEYLFKSPRNTAKPIHPHFLEVWVKKAASWAGLDHLDLTVHVLRHTFGTQLAESGASVYEIRDLMGHSSIVVSENYVKLASAKANQAHRKAFGQTGSFSHALRLSGVPGAFETILKAHRLGNAKKHPSKRRS